MDATGHWLSMFRLIALVLAFAAGAQSSGVDVRQCVMVVNPDTPQPSQAQWAASESVAAALQLPTPPLACLGDSSSSSTYFEGRVVSRVTIRLTLAAKVAHHSEGILSALSAILPFPYSVDVKQQE
jgi:hypothetical protein